MKLHILTVAELHWRNGHEFALQALQLAKAKGLDFTYQIVGQGDFLEAVAFARHELGLKAEVKLKMTASPVEIDALYVWADVFLIAAVAFGAANQLAQAVESALPVLCTDTPRLVSESINAGKIVVVSRRNPQAIANCLLAFNVRRRS